MKLTVIILVICHLSFSSSQNITNGCELGLNTDLPKKNDPVYLVRNIEGKLVLALPDDGAIRLIKAQELVLACTGSKNTLQASGANVTNTKCSSGTNLNVGGKDIPSANLNCTSRSLASLLITDNNCSNKDANIIQSGYQVGTGWFPLVDTCHNINESNSYWSSHILYGSRINGSVIQSYRPGFSRGDKRLYYGFNPDDSYTQANQVDVFTRIYGNNSAAKYIIPDQQVYLARGHLSPDGDFLFGTWQTLTYFYVNVAPQWQSINAGNWLSVENNARKLAMNLQVDIFDVTGTYGVLSLSDDAGVMKKAYLQDDRLPVPELFWKLLQNTKNNSCIVLVSTNNPHLKSTPKTVCPDICAENGWPLLQKDLSKGYVYCCDYASFKATAPQVPQVTCNSVLKFQ